MKTITQKIRVASIGLMTAAAIMLPGISLAGPVDTIKHKVTDAQAKLNKVYGQFQNGAPLVKVLKNGKLIADLKDIMMFLNNQRADYQQFASSGVYVFADDMNGLFSGIGEIGSAMKMEGLGERLQKSQDLIAKLPPQFMYIMHKAIGPSVVKLREDIQALSEKMAVVAELPNSRELLKEPELHRPEICPLVKDKKTKVAYAVIMARLNMFSIKLDYINDMIPEDMTITINVVGGGGTNVPFPAKPLSQTLVLIKDRIKQRLENANDIADALCG